MASSIEVVGKKLLWLMLLSIQMKTKRADPSKGRIGEVESARNHFLRHDVHDEEMIWMMMMILTLF